jgi:uncharacterized protein YqjF (DUF2071 family)
MPENSTPPSTVRRSKQRPWPLPQRRWALSMQWHDLLFMHWPVPAEGLRPAIPPSLEIDTFEGCAWVGIVPFVMRGVRPRYLPAVPGLSHFPELNVRTYVYARGAGSREAGKPGVWFFSLDAHQSVAVRLARLAFRLPYFDARMAAATDAQGTVRYVGRRTHAGAPPADFRARYRPTGPPRAEPDDLTCFLTERYCLYAARAPSGGNATGAEAVVYRGEIHHRPWPLQPAEAQVETNTLTGALPFDLPERAPHLRFARRLDVLAWLPSRVVT